MVEVFGYDLKDVLHSTIKFAATNPWQFISYVLLVLSPLFLISAILAWKQAKEIQHKEKDKKQRAKREENIAMIAWKRAQEMQHKEEDKKQRAKPEAKIARNQRHKDD